MAAIADALYSRLSGYAPLTALTDRIQPADTSGTTAAPYVTYQLIDTVWDRAFGPTYDRVTARVQINAWADRYDDAQDVMEEVHNALRGFSGTEATIAIQDMHPIDEGDIFDEAGEMHGRRSDYAIVYLGP